MPMPANWLAIAVSALVVFMIGWIWYGPLFSKPWASGMGYDMNGDMKMDPKMLVVSYLLSFFTAWTLSTLLDAGQVADLAVALRTTLLIWLGLVATTFALNQVYDSRPWRVWAINVGYHLVGMLATAAIVTLWR